MFCFLIKLSFNQSIISRAINSSSHHGEEVQLQRLQCRKIEEDVLKVDITKPQIYVEVTEHLVKLKDDGLTNEASRIKSQKYQRYVDLLPY